MEDGEKKIDLMEPTGMDRPWNEHQVGIVVPEPLDRPGTSMRRTAVKGCDSGFGFTAAEDFGLVDVQGGQIGPGSQPPDFHRLTGLWR